VKGAFSRQSLLSMLFKRTIAAEDSFRRLKGFDWVAEVIRGVKFVDGMREDQVMQQRKAAG
jgi:putative transposase